MEDLRQSFCVEVIDNLYVAGTSEDFKVRVTEKVPKDETPKVKEYPKDGTFFRESAIYTRSCIVSACIIDYLDLDIEDVRGTVEDITI